ncbi:MAG: PEPxxWA-CTERM sorting domain-containing protein [Janthinobacterium lividum]
MSRFFRRGAAAARAVLSAASVTAAVLSAASASAKTVNATAANFVAVFAAATPGEVIRLSGRFGLTSLTNKTWATPVTIDARAATFTDTLAIKNVSGLNVIGGQYGSTTGATRYNKAVLVYNGSNVSFTKAAFVGANTGQGIVFVGTAGAKVTNSSFTHLGGGLGLTSVTGATITGNVSIYSMSDGFDIAGSHNVGISNNSCSSGTPAAGAHPDCVQLWSIAGQAPQSDITISRNVASGATQGFTSFDAAQGGGIRLSIVSNQVNTSYSQGVACYACIDSNISYNSLTTLAGSAHLTNLNVIGGSNNTIVGNKIGGFTPPLGALDALFAEKAMTPEGMLRQSLTSLAALGVTSEVPEPASWAMMLVGFGLVGVAARRRGTSGMPA